MKYQPKANGMLVEEPFWDDVPVIQRQDEFPSNDFQTDDHLTPSDEPPAEEVPPVPSPESNIAPAEEEADEVPSPEVSKSQDERPDDAPPPILLLDQHANPSAEEPLSPRNRGSRWLRPTRRKFWLRTSTSGSSVPATFLLLQQPKITQVEAMRQALTDLGLEPGTLTWLTTCGTSSASMPKNIAVLKSTAKKPLFKQDEKLPVLPEITEPQAEEVLAASPEEVTLVVVESGAAVTLDASSVEQEPQISPVNSRMAKDATLYSMEDVEKVKGLCDRMGVDTFLALIDLLD